MEQIARLPKRKHARDYTAREIEEVAIYYGISNFSISMEETAKFLWISAQMCHALCDRAIAEGIVSDEIAQFISDKRNVRARMHGGESASQKSQDKSERLFKLREAANKRD